MKEGCPKNMFGLNIEMKKVRKKTMQSEKLKGF